MLSQPRIYFMHRDTEEKRMQKIIANNYILSICLLSLRICDVEILYFISLTGSKDLTACPGDAALYTLFRYCGMSDLYNRYFIGLPSFILPTTTMFRWITQRS